jgi:hypothetical protein
MAGVVRPARVPTTPRWLPPARTYVAVYTRFSVFFSPGGMSLLTELGIFLVPWCYKHVASMRLFVRLNIPSWNLCDDYLQICRRPSPVAIHKRPLLAELGARLLTYQGLGLILGQESRFRLLGLYSGLAPWLIALFA